MTPFQRHLHRWSDCRACDLCEGRRRVVIARGSVPCDVLFVGEAPGESEDVLGRPFCGPAGQLLDRIISDAFAAWPKSVADVGVIRYSYALTNIVACIPREDDGGKAAEPDPAAIRACAERLQEFVAICRPKLIVRVGALATKWCKPPSGCSVCDIVHPAAILRANIAHQGLMVQRATVILTNALEEIC